MSINFPEQFQTPEEIAEYPEQPMDPPERAPFLVKFFWE